MDGNYFVTLQKKMCVVIKAKDTLMKYESERPFLGQAVYKDLYSPCNCVNLEDSSIVQCNVYPV